ncbi:hypothetical protein TRICI_002889 [Trichomonascus ciferrii]|uniref:Uncharacterized protein n=1 Tax=Trichomonascus ciferrii TaxID=44093 RepID=A0A642V6J2_9ASCO|nr:hypothetical protein TRICI_002889 [Trichomonascus ciferrii]
MDQATRIFRKVVKCGVAVEWLVVADEAVGIDLLHHPGTQDDRLDSSTGQGWLREIVFLPPEGSCRRSSVTRKAWPETISPEQVPLALLTDNRMAVGETRTIHEDLNAFF